MLNQRLLWFVVGALPFVGSLSQTVIASNADLSPDSVALKVEFRYDEDAEVGAIGREVWVCAIPTLTTDDKGFTLEYARGRENYNDRCGDFKNWERSIIIKKSGSSDLSLTLRNVSQEQVDSVTVAFLVVIRRDRNGRSWMSAGTEQGKLEARFYTPPDAIALIEVDSLNLSNAGIPSDIIRSTSDIDGERSEEELQSAVVDAEAVQPRQQPSRPQTDDEGGFFSWLPIWASTFLLGVLCCAGVYLVVWIHHHFMVDTRLKKLERRKRDSSEPSRPPNFKQGPRSNISKDDAAQVFKLLELDPQTLARLDPDNILNQLNTLFSRIHQLEGRKGAEEMAPKDTTRERRPIPADAPEDVFLHWCNNGGGQIGKAFLFQESVEERFRDATVEQVYRDMNNEASLAISKRKEGLGAPQEYWLISHQGRHLLVPQPQSADRFREIHPKIYQASQTSPSRVRSITPATAEVAGDTVRLLSPGRID